MNLTKYKVGYSELHQEAVAIQSRLYFLKPSFRTMLWRKEFNRVEKELELLNSKLFELDKQRVAEFPEGEPGYNSSIMLGASHFLAYNLRESVRTILVSSQEVLNGIHTKLDFLISITVSLLALVISIVALK